MRLNEWSMSVGKYKVRFRWLLDVGNGESWWEPGELWSVLKAHIGCWVLNWSEVESYPAQPWLTIDCGDGVHVMPLDDEVDHVATNTCVCMPNTEHEPGSRPVYIHSSLDGREVRTT